MVKRLSNTDQNNNKLTNVPTPIDNGDAANKQYVDDKENATQTLANKTLTSPTLTGTPVFPASITANSFNVTFPDASTTIVGRSTVDTLTNKRITPRVGYTASAAVVTPVGDSTD